MNEMAHTALELLLARLNHSGADRGLIQDALSRIADSPSLDAQIVASADRAVAEPSGLHVNGGRSFDLRSLAAADRLAMEMTLHEDRERRALEGELDNLSEEWRRAEELGEIADGLLLPPPVENLLRKLKRTHGE